MNKVECSRCGEFIDLKKEKYVKLGTHDGKHMIHEAYFHFNCWRLHFEDKARQKAEAVMKGAKEKMMPMISNLMQRIKQ